MSIVLISNTLSLDYKDTEEIGLLCLALFNGDSCCVSGHTAALRCFKRLLVRLLLPGHPERNIPGPGWLGPALPPVECAFFVPNETHPCHSATSPVLLPTREKSQPVSLLSTCP